MTILTTNCKHAKLHREIDICSSFAMCAQPDRPNPNNISPLGDHNKQTLNHKYYVIVQQEMI